MKSLFVLMLLFASTAAVGSDDDGYYMELGRKSCGQYIEARTERGSKEANNLAWINGYVTAYNSVTPHTYDILAGTHTRRILLWLDNWCKANPLKYLAEGMQELVDGLYPTRQKTAQEAGR